MVKKCSKNKSKRQTCRQKYKIEKKVAEHHRKVRKDQKKKMKANLAGGKRKRVEKEVRVPSEAPFREKVLAEAAAALRETEERRVAARLALRNKKRNLTEIVANAQQADAAWQQKKRSIADSAIASKVTNSAPAERSAKAFHRELEKVLTECDILLEVLDARDPLGTRCPEIEERIRSSGKRLILILNKVDLVPRSVVVRWLEYLRRQAPTLAFKANLQQQASRLGQAPEHFLLSKPDAVAQCVGAQPLMRYLAALSRGHGGERASLTVGVIGLPNTGKSSLINSLKRERVCGAGAVPGVTRATQIVNLDKHLRMMDSPGVVLEKSRSELSAAQLLLRNCVRPEDVEDLEPAVTEVLRHCPAQRLQLHYGMAPFKDTADFLARFAQRCGMLRKGGRPDVMRAARRLLHDWAQGRLIYYTEPPLLQENNEEKAVDEVRFIQEFSKEFDVSKMDESVLSESRNSVDPSTDMLISSYGAATLAPAEQGEDDEYEDEMQSDSDNDDSWTESDCEEENAMSTDEEEEEEKESDSTSTPGGLNVLSGVQLRLKSAEVTETTALPRYLQQNKALRQKQKKTAKKQRRLTDTRKTSNDAQEMDEGDSDSDYNFEDFAPS